MIDNDTSVQVNVKGEFRGRPRMKEGSKRELKCRLLNVTKSFCAYLGNRNRGKNRCSGKVIDSRLVSAADYKDFH